MQDLSQAPTTAPTTADRIAELLRVRIVRGEIEGGAALRQDHIASEFGTSHVPVREAFARLEAIGLVVSLPRRGVRVTTLSQAAIKETVEMRAALEPLALRHSVPHLGAQQVAQLEQAHARCSQADSLVEWDAANCRFHDILSGQCGMPRLLASLKQLQLTNSRYLFAAGLQRGWQPRSDQDHRLIIDALKAGDAERAMQLLGRHIGTMERIGFAT
ncbi:GntR family transcriptional regulator [Herbaspirillum sp. YR522]|uniref:GntR family transcriptional regulator n=1 Tax=Herbaspirillum sp. YR522 TaxID=1144342 RepID=UPI00026F99DB|nr:GntR family transcriptional regulator [Herbaspirillum sp. YR522]EJN06637.1 transcriptional regulator [Herbaspirillum sp. YR522]